MAQYCELLFYVGWQVDHIDNWENLLKYLGNFISDAIASFCLVVSFGTKAMIAVLVNDGATFAFVLDVGVEDGNA